MKTIQNSCAVCSCQLPHSDGSDEVWLVGAAEVIRLCGEGCYKSYVQYRKEQIYDKGKDGAQGEHGSLE